MGSGERARPEQVLRDVVISRAGPSSTSEHPKVLYPSVYDMFVIDMYVPTLLFYRLDSKDPSAFSNLIHAVKKSLSQVLSFYYPMAGKWIVAEDAWTRKLVCDDEGAVFVEATMDDEMDNVLGRDDFSPPEGLTGEHAVPGFKVRSVYKSSESKEYPSLIVQVTRFKCGGVVLALNFHHMTVDGFAFNRFLRAWSEILSTGQPSTKPVFDRSMVSSHLDKSHILGIQPDMENLDDVLASYFKVFLSRVRDNATGNAPSKLFSVRTDAVERLRQKAKEEHVSDILEQPGRFTTFECVSAQLWRCFARIPKLSGKDMVGLHFAVEGRRKWSNPPLPEDYVGNVIMLTGLPVLPGPEVTDKPFSFAATHVHDSVVKVNHNTSGDRLDGLVNLFKETRSIEEKLKFGKPDIVNHNRNIEVTITSWSRFDNFYNLDFGYGGPFLFSPRPPFAEGGVTVFLLPPCPKSVNAVEMCITAPLNYFSILLGDPEFIHLVS